MITNLKIGLVLINYYSEHAIEEYFNKNSIVDMCDEIVIINNGSDYEDKINEFTQMSDRIHIINTGSNLGYAKANNLGMKYLVDKKVGYILVSNNDVKIERLSVEKSIDVLKKRNDLGAVAPRMRKDNGELAPLRYIELGYKRLFLRILIPETIIDKMSQSKLISQDNVVLQSFLPGSFFAITAEAAVACNFFEEDTFLYGEEEILNKRLMRCGYMQGVVLDCDYQHLHIYRHESAKKRYQDCKILMDSERLYFKKYLLANNLQMLLVNILQRLYVGVRYLSWIKDERSR